MIICPSCGSKVDSDLCLGCPSCGARAVGPPLAKAEHELASYGRAGVALGSGTAMSAALLVAIVAALVENKGVWLGLSNIVTAGEVAAWRLKWVAFPVAIAVLWSSAQIIRSIKNGGRDRFIGLRAARAGFAASAVVTVLIATLIGITIPVRLERRQWAIEAATNAQYYALARAQLEYRDLNGTLPSQDDLVKELSTLPDPDGSIAEALRNLDVSGYEASTVVAAASTKSKSLPRGSAISKAATSANPATDRGVSFTSYKWRLPGEDKILNTDDDVILQDGLITKVSDLPSSSSSLASPRAP